MKIVRKGKMRPEVEQHRITYAILKNMMFDLRRMKQ